MQKTSKVNCWEHWNCARASAAHSNGPGGSCPAATETTCNGINGGANAGRICWAVAGAGCLHGSPDPGKELLGCGECAFYRRVKYEEGPHFQPLKLGLGKTDPAELHGLLNNAAKLAAVSRDIFASLAVGPFLERVAEHARLATGAESSAIYMSGASGSLELEAASGAPCWPGMIDRSDVSPVAAADTSGRLRYGPVRLGSPSQPGEVLAVPVGGNPGHRRVLAVFKTGGQLASDDRWFMQELSIIAGLGVGSARLLADRNELREFDKAKSKFVRLLMHQVMSPLATVACSLRALDELDARLSPDDRRKLLDSSIEHVASVRILAQRLLNLSAIRAGRSLRDIRPVRLLDAIRPEIAARDSQVQSENVDIRIDDHGQDGWVLADPEGLRVIFANLLDNAIRYSREGRKHIDIDVSEDGDWVRVCFADEGVGISEEDQRHVFDEFFRARSAAVSRILGSGLGLAFVRELINTYGGKIEIASEVGKGTRFFIAFPAAVRRIGEEAMA